jgi:hypothetical protein
MRPLAFTHDRNFGCRIRELVYRGHRCVSLENARVRLLVAADKGADILEFLYKPLDVECLWRSRLGLRPDEHLHFSSPLATGHFRDYFPGGWYEMLPNGPEPCVHRGAEFGFHGEATLLPWTYRIERDDPEEIRVSFQARLARIPLRVERTMTLRDNSGTVTITGRVTNEAAQTVDFLWGHHPTFGWPLVDEGTRIYLPACDAVVSMKTPAGTRLAPGQRHAWPMLQACDGSHIDLSVIPGPDAASHDFVRLEGLADGWFAIVNPSRRVGFALRWDRAVFPLLGLWQIWGGAADYPWYGLPHLLALEPVCELPSLAAAHAKGTALVLNGGQTLETTLEATVFEGAPAVTHVGPGGEVR